jgi:uncharacterized membrane protein
VVVPAVFASVTVVSYKYTHWQLQQARQKKPIHFFEQAFLAMMILGVLGSVLIGFGLMVLFGGFLAFVAAVVGSI